MNKYILITDNLKQESVKNRIDFYMSSVGVDPSDYYVFSMSTVEQTRKLYEFLNSDIFEPDKFRFITFGKLTSENFDTFFDSYYNYLDLPSLKTNKNVYKSELDELNNIRLIEEYIHER